jgi:hypothetical protein
VFCCIQEVGILAGLEVLTARVMKSSLFLVITACSLLKVADMPPPSSGYKNKPSMKAT